MVLATDAIGIDILLDPKLACSLPDSASKWGTKDDPVGLSPCYLERSKAVHGEIGVTGLIRSKGYEVDVMMTAFSADDNDTLVDYCASSRRTADPLVEGHYFGASVHPYEMVFIKSNRNAAKDALRVLTSLHLGQHWSSWDSCVLP
ncbi:hypothetical protein SEUCBS139899_004271 [Sporothrix eucalyptigena]|uniref:Uncharacterized protein n=1 Tax=Sporothrix eucalyptigena TaxID=1812306 RepID=A0ABP0BSX8_9PEZI